MTSSRLPRMIDPASYPTIAAETAKRDADAIRKGGEDWHKHQQDIDSQNVFLEHFEKTFSVGQSMRRSYASMPVYQRWRRTSLYFVQKFNEIVEQWHDDIYVNTAMKARGYRVADNTTQSGYKEGPDGEILYFDADPKLQAMYLKMMHPEFNEKIDLNHQGGTVNTTKVIKVQGVKSNPRPEPKDVPHDNSDDL